jgi:hypothetical protein
MTRRSRFSLVLRWPSSLKALFGLLGALLGCVHGYAGAPANERPQEIETAPPAHLDRWTFQVGAAFITANTIDNFLTGNVRRARGPAEGEIYLFKASYTLRDLEWNIGDRTFRPQLELPFVFGVVDERARAPWFDYNLGLTLRWKDFPWDRFLYTNLESGAGLSYSQRVFHIEEARHPGRERSHLKFYWPIELAVAHPSLRQHQFVFLLHHQSGGQLFDVGGSNHLGVAYRHVFRER